MAEIRTERTQGGHAWVWVLVALVVVVAAVLLLAWAGYIELPFQLGSATALPAQGEGLASAPTTLLQEARS